MWPTINLILSHKVDYISKNNKTENAVQSYAARKTTLEVVLRMKILSNKSVIAEYTNAMQC